MTIPEFLEKLRETEGPWDVIDGAIRCGPNCPITSVGQGSDSEEYCEIGRSLRLDSDDILDIAFAADYDDAVLADLRQELLAATVYREAPPRSPRRHKAGAGSRLRRGLRDRSCR